MPLATGYAFITNFILHNEITMSKHTLTLADTQFPVVKLHPTAVFEILNTFMRRSDKNQRIIGTLLGSIKDNVVEVNRCAFLPSETFL